MVKYPEEKPSKSKGLDSVKASDERQITGKATDAERIHQEEIIQTRKNKLTKTKRELKKQQQLVRSLKQKCEETRQSAMRQIEEKELELAIHASLATAEAESRAIAAENKLTKTKTELKKQQQLVQSLKQKCEETRQSAMRQIEEREIELDIHASLATLEAESRAIAAEVCVICWNNEKDMAFGCGHTTCRDCGLKISHCPICRRRITSRLRLFLG